MQGPVKHIRWMPVLMTLTILGIAAFQVYWLRKAFEREERTLEMRTNMMFRETIYSLQGSKLRMDKVMIDSIQQSGFNKRVRQEDISSEAPASSEQKMLRMVNVLRDRVKDSVRDKTIILSERMPHDSLFPARMKPGKKARIMQFLYEVDSLQDSVRIPEIELAYKSWMNQQNIDVPFHISRTDGARERERAFNEVTLGIRYPVTYSLHLESTTPYLLRRIAAPILLSLFLLAFAIISFSLLYRNLLKQQKLADIKNEFISNITHELKTPIATVSVAIEALRSFSSSMDAQKTKEYLDISANELQRLSLLVDKVLKLSMFEKKEIDLKYEQVDVKSLVHEVASSLRLQIEKHKASLDITSSGDTTLMGDRLHLVSVMFNLIDNALKYSNNQPQIRISLEGSDKAVSIHVQDKGIGIPAEYKDKVFEKFFRVPTGNVHNAKGYGLGLSYVAQVIRKHRGQISVDSQEGQGSKFVIHLPKNLDEKS